MLLPSSVKIGSGCIIDTYGGTSKQQDIVVYERDFCPVFSINDNPETTYYPCEGVIAIGEVKSILDSSQLNDSLKKIKSVKKLVRYSQNLSTWRKYGSSLIMVGTEEEVFNQVINIKDQIYGFILCEKLGISINVFMDKFVTECSKTPAHLLPNIIVSLKDGLFIYIDANKRVIREDMNNSTGIYHIKNPNGEFQYLLNKLYQIIIRGRTSAEPPTEKYIISSSKVPDNGTYKQFV